MSRHGRGRAFPAILSSDQKVKKVLLEEIIPENAIFVDPVSEKPYNNIIELINKSTLNGKARARARDIYTGFMDTRLFNWAAVLMLTYHSGEHSFEVAHMPNETPLNAFRELNAEITHLAKGDCGILGYGFVLYPGNEVLHEHESIKAYFLQKGIADEDVMLKARLREVLSNLPTHLTL